MCICIYIYIYIYLYIAAGPASGSDGFTVNMVSSKNRLARHPSCTRHVRLNRCFEAARTLYIHTFFSISLSLSLYMYIYIYTVYVHIHIHIYIYIHISLSIYIHTYIHTCILSMAAKCMARAVCVGKHALNIRFGRHLGLCLARACTCVRVPLGRARARHRARAREARLSP